MSKQDDQKELANLRCPHCQSTVHYWWNKVTTGRVLCDNRCSAGKRLMRLDECIDISQDEEDLMLVEDLEDI